MLLVNSLLFYRLFASKPALFMPLVPYPAPISGNKMLEKLFLLPEGVFCRSVAVSEDGMLDVDGLERRCTFLSSFY